MKRYNVSVPRSYEKDGETKTAWNTVGKLVHFPATGDKPEGFILELSMFPNTKFGVFEEKPREPKEEATVDL
jgi:hypothetical protein